MLAPIPGRSLLFARRKREATTTLLRRRRRRRSRWPRTPRLDPPRRHRCFHRRKLTPFCHPYRTQIVNCLHRVCATLRRPKSKADWRHPPPCCAMVRSFRRSPAPRRHCRACYPLTTYPRQRSLSRTLLHPMPLQLRHSTSASRPPMTRL